MSATEMCDGLCRFKDFVLRGMQFFHPSSNSNLTLAHRPTITLALVLTAAMVTAIGSEPGTLQASTFEIHGVFRKKIQKIVAFTY